MTTTAHGKLFIFIVLLLAAVWLAGCGGTDNIQPPTPLADIDTKLPVSHAWSENTGAGQGKHFLRLNPWLRDDQVFVADSAGRVSVYQVPTGQRVWRTELDTSLTAGVNGGEALIAVGTEGGEVIALDTGTGKELWRARLSSQVMAISGISRGIIVTRSGDGHLYGLDAGSGEIRWKFKRAVPPLSLQTQSVPVIESGAIIAGLDDGRVVKLEINSGRILWEKSIAAARGRSELERLVDIDGQIVVADNIVYAATYQGRIAALDASSGRILWAHDASSLNGIAVQRELLFYTDENSAVWALDRGTGASVWKQEALKFRRLTAPAAQGNTLVVADYKGYLHWLDRQSGEILARKRADHAGVLATPVVFNNWMLVLGQGGELSNWYLPEGSG